MSNIVEQVFDSVTSIFQANLTGYTPLRRVFNPELGDLRNISKGYGVIHGAASDTTGPIRFYNLDHSFKGVLVRSFVERLDDAAIQEVINELYDKIDTLLVQMFLTKLNLPAIVSIVNNPSIDEPEILDNQAVVIRFGFNVKYRNQIA